MNWGSLGVGSSFSRRWRTWTSIVRGSLYAESPQSATRSAWRLYTLPGFDASVASNSNSTYVSSTGSPFDLDSTARRIDNEAVDGDRLHVVAVVLGGRSAAQGRFHATAKLPDRERLRDVVVGAQLEPEYLVHLVITGREHDDRHVADSP